MRLTMEQRQAVVKRTLARYRRAGKREKKLILDEFVHLTGYHRVYARAVLRGAARGSRGTAWKRPGRKRVYEGRVLEVLRRVWAILDGICGKRLAVALKNVPAILERHREIELDPETRKKLSTLSAATIDRLLAPEKKKMEWKGRSLTKPGTLLKHQIPIRTFSEWDEGKVGFLEIDLVGHDGGHLQGDFCCTLDGTDIRTQWTETEAVKNKAQVHVFAALLAIQARLPFPLLGLDSDNGSEFINGELLRYCREKKITFTRSRPYRKNDSCHVEEKNYSIVRRFVGYRRYDTEAELLVLNELYRNLRLYTNFFLPSMRLLKKTRKGSQVKKQYEAPKTPYQRVLESREVSWQRKRELRRQYANLNPAHLKRVITRLQEKLLDLAEKKTQGANPTSSLPVKGKRGGARWKPPENHPWRKTFGKPR